MSDDDPIGQAQAAIDRGDVRNAGRLAASVSPQNEVEAVQLQLIQAMVLIHTGFPDDASPISRRALSAARALGKELELEALLVHAMGQAHRRVEADVAALLERALRLAPPGSVQRGQALTRLASHAVTRQEMDRATASIHEAVELLEGNGRRYLAAKARMLLANIWLRQGMLDEAGGELDSLLPWILEGPLHSAQGAYHTLRAQHAWLGGDLDTADAELERSATIYGTLGMLPHQADCSVNRAELLRGAGRLQEARRLYEALLATQNEGDASFFAQINLAVLKLQLGEPDAAAALALRAIEGRDPRLNWLDGLLQLLALPRCEDSEQAWAAVRLARRSLLDGPVVYEPDAASVPRLLGTLFEERGDAELAGGLYALALDQLARLGADDEEKQPMIDALERLRQLGLRPWVGAARLVEVLGRGGMGSVWRARSVRDGPDIAVKVIPGGDTGTAGSSHAAASLEREVHQVAALRHPAIVDVLDTGRIPLSAEALSGGQLVAGSPWVSMELVEGGTLRDLCGRVDWATAHEVLRVLLDALAHAHGRGLVHLDLKPANVLVSWSDPDRPERVMLTDFGIAQGFRDAARDALTGGTPRYMAPEQFQGQRRRVGPWTDLYALGCVAYQLLTGQAPFVGSRDQLTHAHMHQEPPPLRAVCAVPEGLEGWLARLLVKHPMERFLRAADAAAALAEVADGPLVSSNQSAEPTLSLGQADTWVLDAVTVDPNAPVAEEPAAAQRGIASVPALCCPPEPPPDPPLRTRRSMALLAYRSPPVIGRQSDRAALWSALHEVHTTRTCQWIEVTAPPGLRVHALCEWLAFRAHELGLASPVVVRRGQDIQVAVTGPLGLHGLEGPLLRRSLAMRARHWGLDSEGLERLVASAETEWTEADVKLWLRAVVQERGVVAVLETPSPMLRRIAADLQGQPVPMLVVSYRDPLAPAPDVPAPRTLALEALSDAELFAGLEEPLLVPELRHELVHRAQGCEAVVHGMLAHHLGRAELFDGPDGIQRRPSFSSELRLHPGDAWLDRVRAWHRDASPEVWAALERVCMVIEPVTQLPSQQADALQHLGWIREVPGGWVPRVAHLRSSVRTLMLEQGRFGSVAAACVSEGGWSPGTMAALCRWAGRIDAAEENYRASVSLHVQRGEPLAAWGEWRRWVRTARQLGLGEDDPRWQEGQRLFASFSSAEGENPG